MVEAEFVEFKIPYLLKLKDSIDENPDWRFEIDRGGQIAEIRFQKEKSKDYEYTAFPEGDRSGRLCWTKVQVRFPGGLNEDGKSVDGTLIRASREAINRFLEAYRAVMEDEWIRDLAFQDIVEFEVYWDHGSDVENNTVYVPNDTFGGSGLDEQKKDKIQEYLDDDVRINSAKRMDLNTQEKIHRGEYELAVINADRLFEFWAVNVFVYLKEQRGTPTEEAVSLVTNNGIKNIISNFYQDHLGSDFKNTDEYEEWSKKTHDLRNNVIHEGWQVTEEEAQDAYDASLSAIATISEEFEDELRGTTLFPEVDYPG
ncbi:hypothetical protein [Halomicrobium salinisoli]|uniref:hypothetical protein n=1 Tax=Halomicrobium salinisoli TaxID=2878391 RepID=UPI001CF00030|nr:hypothetical protein [Halomicrobium salinisoli]